MKLEADNQRIPPAITNRAWMITFSDLVSLLLAFFVLLFSMYNVKFDRWQSTVDSLSEALNPRRADAVAPFSSPFSMGKVSRRRVIDLDYLATLLRQSVKSDALLSESQIMRRADRLIVALPGDLLFDPGRAVLSQRARDAVFNLGGILRALGNRIGVNGHSDPAPLTSPEYKSNWELSLARAAAVANTLRRSGYDKEIVAYGFADSRYHELPEMNEAQRQALARRVDIVVFATAGNP